jgi:lipopolysaccharide transport system permease protein
MRESVTIRPAKSWVSLDLKGLWQRRELVYFLVWRDIKVRYKQTSLGMAWALIHPIVTLTIYGVFFGWIAKVPSEGLPYPIFAFSALLPWQLFSSIVTASSNSLVANQHLITKVSFPRLVLPISSAAVSLVDFSLAVLALVGMMAFYGIAPTWQFLMAPFLIALVLILGIGVGTWLSALNVRYRDVSHVVPFFLQVWLFATPIFYPLSLIPERLRGLYCLNPMVGIAEGFRWAMLGAGRPDALLMVVSLTVGLLAIVSGAYFFRRAEQTFADVV